MCNRSLLLVLLFTFTVGCNDKDLLAGRRLVLQSHEGAAKLAGSKLELRFSDDELGVYAGCNHINASYRIRGGTLRIENSSATLMLCEPAVEAEDWFQKFLGASPSIEVLPSRAVVMRQGKARLVFVDEKETPPSSAH